MSHIAKINLQINDLTALKRAVAKLGGQFKENQKTYNWYQTWVGDTPMPEGLTREDLGKCDHAITFPDCKYEVGVVKSKTHKGYELLWDYWHQGGLQKIIGKEGGKLKQSYTAERIKAEAIKKKAMVTEKSKDGKVQIKISVK